MSDSIRIIDIVPTRSLELSSFFRVALPEAMKMSYPDGNALAFFRNRDYLSVLVGLEDHGKDGLWLHSSASCGGLRLPSWGQLSEVKQLVHGDRLAIQLLPPKSDYVNVSEVLHLWERLDAPTIAESVWRIR